MKTIISLFAVLGLFSIAHAEDQKAPVVEPVSNVPVTAATGETPETARVDADKKEVRKARKAAKKAKKEARIARKKARRAEIAERKAARNARLHARSKKAHSDVNHEATEASDTQ